jgi:hypothetical protein
MKPRIEKKLSKKLAEILKEKQGFKPNQVWIDDEYADDICSIHYKWNNPNGFTSKQKSQNLDRTGVAVNHMPSIGGAADEWGEGTDYETVFVRAQDAICWCCFPCEDEAGEPTYPQVNIRLTGKAVIQLARKYVSQGGAA